MSELTKWPDMTLDQKAWDRAKRELPHADFSQIALRAQELKANQMLSACAECDAEFWDANGNPICPRCRVFKFLADTSRKPVISKANWRNVALIASFWAMFLLVVSAFWWEAAR
jgi:hypothetical protein